MNVSLELAEKEIKPRSVFGLIQVNIEMDTSGSLQAAMANALIYLAHKHLTSGQTTTGKLDLPKFGAFESGSGSVSWSVNVRDGNP